MHNTDVRLARQRLSWLAVLLLAALAGCGFQLRGKVDLPPVLQSAFLQIASGERSTLYQGIRIGLNANGATVVTDRKLATAIVEVGAESVSKQTLVKSASGSSLEYELGYHVDFRVTAADGKVLLEDSSAAVTKIAVEPVWWLPGVARRFKVSEADLRRALFEETGGMYPELVTRSDLEVFLPPVGGQTVYIFGDAHDLADPQIELTARVHDECNGSDVFGSDICTCRPYLTHAIEECILGAQRGGVGLVAYSRKEGRALGEVTKFLVYNARKRQVGGDTADQYFARTECVAGVQDMRFQELMPDVLHWLGIRKIHRLVSMSNDKYDAITGSGIEVGERVKIPDELVPADAKVEMEAKIAALQADHRPSVKPKRPAPASHVDTLVKEKPTKKRPTTKAKD